MRQTWTASTPWAVGIALLLGACASASEGSGAIPIPGQAASGGDVGLVTESGDDDETATGSSTSEAPTDEAASTPTEPVGTAGVDDDEPDPSADRDDRDPAPTTTPTDGTEPDAEDTGETATTTPDSQDDDGSTTTTTVPELDVYDPLCVVKVASGDSLGLIADEFDDPTVNVSTIISENDLENADVIYPDQLLDVCVDNGLDDITGAERAPNQALADAARRTAVERQQEKLNELFDGSGMRELLVDGISGPVTQQRLCAARVALGLPVTRDDMEEGSAEEELLFATDQLRQPFTTALLSERWILIDRTCQVMFTGEGDNGIVNIFSTSTGEAGYETRDQDRTRAYRFDPALQNGGWHNSTTYPVPEDNPLNGNMYKPLYFDGGQAIHGSNNVPTTPQSKGCARLRVEDQERLIAWLGLGDVPAPTYDTRRINVTVNVQGAYDAPAGA